MNHVLPNICKCWRIFLDIENMPCTPSLVKTNYEQGPSKIIESSRVFYNNLSFPTHNATLSFYVFNKWIFMKRNFGGLWCGVVWCGVVWCGVVWCGVVWCSVVWCGVVCLSDLQFLLAFTSQWFPSSIVVCTSVRLKFSFRTLRILFRSKSVHKL